MNFSVLYFIIFVLFAIGFLYIKREKVAFQKIAYPFFYIILYRTKIGLKLIERWAKKYREVLKFLGLVSIGLGFFYMVNAIFSIGASYYIIVKYLFKPVSPLFIPGINIPGEGVVSFSSWIIGIFVIASVHEFAHGVIAAVYKVRIKSTGVGFLSFIVPIFPAFFVEPDEKQMGRKSDVVQYSILSAGPIANLAVYFVLALAVSYLFVPFMNAYAEPAGVSIEAINAEYPAGKFFKDRVNVVEVNNLTVNNTDEFTKSLANIKPGDKVRLKLQNSSSYLLTAAKDPNNPERGYIGVFGFRDNYVWENKTFGNCFEWFLSLIRLLGLLNLIVALVNLLPMFLTDGAKMTQVLFLKLFKKQAAVKLWLIVNAATAILVLGSVVLPYALRWFN